MHSFATCLRVTAGLAACALLLSHPLVARADSATLVPPKGFVAYPQSDKAVRAWVDRSNPSERVPQSLSITSDEYTGDLAGWVKDRLAAGVNSGKSGGVLRQSDIPLCAGKRGHFVVAEYTEQGIRFHSESIFAISGSRGYTANYIRAVSQPVKPAAENALRGFCVR
jgi:hypothetical protein